MQPRAEVDGVEVVERPSCEQWVVGVCRRSFAVPSRGVVLAVTIHAPGDGSYEAVRDSLRLLGPDAVTVPLAAEGRTTPAYGAPPGGADAFVRAVERAGPEVAVEVAERPEDDAAGSWASLPEGSLSEVRPAPGTPVARDGTVGVTLSGASMDDGQ